jgi:FkbM family methyltransferase
MTLLLPDADNALALLENIFSHAPASIPPVENHAGGVILYGAGNLGRLAFDFLQHVGVPVKFALDRAASPETYLAPGLTVYPPHAAPQHETDLILVTTVSTPFTTIKRDLTRLGFKRILPFYDYAQHHAARHPLNNGWFAGPLSAEDQSGMEAVLMSLVEPQSRAAYLQFLAWRILREDWIFDAAPVTPDDRYFIKPVTDSLTNCEDYIDVGAYDGRVFMRLLEITRNQFASALLIEPDAENLQMLNATLEDLPVEARLKITISPLAIADAKGRIPFSHGFKMTSRVCDNASQLADCIRLDELDASVSFLKLHIEGGEYNALRGGMNMLHRHRPIIASTIYHSRDGLWKTISLLNKSLEEYEIAVRLHSWCGTGFVMYWLPQEKLLHRETS